MSDERDAGAAPPPPAAEPRPRRRRWRRIGYAVLALGVGTAYWWGPPALSHLAFFRARRVQIEGAVYTPSRDILRQLHVDTTVSVWTALGPLESRVARLPEVQSVVIRRKLPGTLVVHVTERVPVALVPTSRGLRPYDESGLPLPIDPARTPVDAPILTRRDTAALRLLGTLKRQAPELYQRVSEVRRAGDELDLSLASVVVRAMADVTVRRLEDVEPVERDLANRRLTVAELDLRYRDQVIARLK
ncbi:MAG TPA: FtsQ-type POTRA domain-containing protein [Gemmatimonadaceae bacterium]|nr:FtsQ-type POTRA domain-containing protein [Gemmatimonadaceae bacterium]